MKFFIFFFVLINYFFLISNIFANEYSDDYFKNMNSKHLENKLSIEKGKSKYNTNCISCHGSQGKGARAPTLVSNGFAPGGVYDNKFFFNTIKYGRQGTIMGSFENILSDDDIWHIIAYLRIESHKTLE